ncbi:VOC family protein [Jiangella alba]|uniref:Glyoxalase/Bleomycin resistance protein/Dioxygenase superfamily protein n=1 Tax=Jiangella alba TaxID=561176 RepID=A0A1H5PYF4_9ACTN|nr:VOC family protein [Jiangella alba]SEF18739.1 Glyoxalase/Bleomycin resistance protein/Dioxygenase superfamily protein [Jiangella alba]
MTPNGFVVDQVAFVVPDLAAALPAYDAIFSGSPWRIWDYGPSVMSEQAFRGEPSAYSMRLALSATRPQVELIQPLHGRSVYSEWLERGGTGVHHVGMFVDDIGEASDALGLPLATAAQTGSGYGAGGDGGFAYFDAVPEVDLILELIAVPQTRRPPDTVWERTH